MSNPPLRRLYPIGQDGAKERKKRRREKSLLSCVWLFISIANCGVQGVFGIKKAAELPDDFRPFHGLRHNFGVTPANSGKFNISEISEALTHKNLTFTKERYAQFLPDTLTKIGNSAASILNVSVDPQSKNVENA